MTFAVLLGTAAQWAQSADPKAAGFYEDALTRYEKHDYAGAIVQLKNALQRDKSMLSVQVLLGKALLANSQMAASEIAFTEALRLGVNRAEVVVPMAKAVVAQGKQQQIVEQDRFSPAGLPQGVQAELLLIRAGAYSDLGDPRNAMKAIEDSRAVDGASPDSWMAEVPVRIRGRQLKEALAAADKALTLAPDLAEANYLRGTVSHVQGDTATALAFYDRALKADPKHTEALVSRAGLLLDLNRPADAARDVAELIRSSPKEPRGRYIQALLADRQGDTAAAKAALRDVTGLLDPVPMEFMRYRTQLLMLGGLAHYGLDEKAKAKPYLEAVQRTQQNGAVSKLLAQIYLSEKNIDRAIESLDLYLKGQPNDSQAQMLLASAHMSQGRYARATQLMQDALKVQDQPSVRTLLGLSLFGGGKLGDAVTELEAALRKDPAQVQAATALTNIYIQSGQAAKAVRVADGLLKLDSKNPGFLNLAGMARAANGDLASARTAYEQALKSDPGFVAPQINLARLDMDAKAYGEAARRLDGLLKADDKNVDAISAMGRVYELQGKIPEAQRSLERADDLSGQNNLQPGLVLVDFFLRNNRPDAAQEATKRLTAKSPDSMLVLLTLARVNLANGDAATARTNLTRASNQANYDAPLLVRIALLQLQAGHTPGAAYSLEKALQDRPDYLPAQALMTDVDMRRGEIVKAEQRAKQIVSSFPKLGVGYGLLGDIAMARHQPAVAVDNYRRAHQIDQTSESMLRLHGAMQGSDPAAATQLAEQWVKSHPGDVAARRAIAEGYARSGRMPAARAAYEALLKVVPEDAEALNNLANVQITMNDYAGATKTADKAMAMRPGIPAIIGTAGWAAFKAGQPERGLQLLRDARLRDPNNLDTRYFLAAVLASSGRTSEAREEASAAVHSGRPFVYRKEADQLLATLK